MSDLPNVENSMLSGPQPDDCEMEENLIPYAEMSDRFLQDHDTFNDLERSDEDDVQRRDQEQAERRRKHRIASLSDTLYEIGSLPGLGRRQVG